jgi:hypothetical protein
MRLGISCLALLVAVLCLAGVTAASGSATFTDPAGDTPAAAPDLTNVTVSNDDQGLITFHITVANRSALGPDDVVAVLIGTDDPNAFAGRRDDGINFVLVLDGTQGASLLEWNGIDLDPIDPGPGAVSGSFSGGAATLTVRQEDLAPGFPDLSVPIQLDFVVLGIAFSGNDVVAQDDAPEADFWHYRLSEPLRVIVTNFDAGKTVKAGKTLVVLMGAAHGDTGAAVTKGKVTCRARLGNRALRGKGAFVTVIVKAAGASVKSPNAACSWKVPKNAKGKTIRGTMTLSESGVANTRSFITHVR